MGQEKQSTQGSPTKGKRGRKGVNQIPIKTNDRTEVTGDTTIDNYNLNDTQKREVKFQQDSSR